MRRFRAAMLAGLLSAALFSTAEANPPQPPILPPAQPPAEPQLRPIAYSHLAAFGNLVWQLDEFRDNEFLFEEHIVEIGRYAKALEGRQLIWYVAVERVDKADVYVEVPDADRTRVVVLSGQTQQALDANFYFRDWSHKHLTNSRYLNYYGPPSISRYRAYYGPPSTMRYNLLAAPTALRIGEAIELDDAKQLRKGDVLRMSGNVKLVMAMVPTDFANDVIVVISEAKVTAIEPLNISP